jgi:hypothetical protein
MRTKITFSLVLGGLPLPIYPGVLLAGIMSLGGSRTGDEPALLMAIVTSFLIGSIAYPLIYIPCAVAAVRAAKRQEESLAFKISIVPLVFISVLAMLLLAWLQFET